MEATPRPRRWKTLLAFAIIYVVWGSTFLAIRIGVREVPPLLLAGMRFFAAGIVLYGWMRATGTASPTRREWVSTTLLAVLIFLVDYGLVFWAEQRVPSGITAVMLATIPVFTALAEILILRTQRLTLRLGIALLVGLAGVAVLVSRSVSFGDAPIDSSGAIALVVGAISWSLASVLSRKLNLPQSKVMSSGAQMLVGGILLMLAAAMFGEFRGFHCTGRVGSRLARAALPDRRRLHHRLHRLRLAHPPRISHQSRHLRLCEPGDRRAARIFLRRGSVGRAHDLGNVPGAGECSGDHNHPEERGEDRGADQKRDSARLIDFYSEASSRGPRPSVSVYSEASSRSPAFSPAGRGISRGSFVTFGL